MGAASSVFSEEELQDYRDLTGLAKAEVLHLHSRFHTLDPDSVTHDRQGPISKAIISRNLTELLANPFRERICHTFSSAGDGSLTFDDFLDLVTAFGEKSNREKKIQWAFQIYDFDNDNRIGRSDLKTMVNYLCGLDSPLSNESEQLDETDCKFVVDGILKEADLDESGYLTFHEFYLLMMKMPDFLETFRIRF